MFCRDGGCAKRRKKLKRFVKTAFSGGNKSVSVPENNAITTKYVDRMNNKFRKKKL